ncbi:MAG: cell division protein ZapA [Bacteroidota bacterium]|nr:cell division protein ZapA [Bacteroidota bacterium]
MSELSISLNIADRSYKLMIEKEQEEEFRKAAKLIENKIKEYSTNYAYKDKQDLLAMVALEFTINYLSNESKAYQNGQDLDEKLIGIKQALDEILNSPSA